MDRTLSQSAQAAKVASVFPPHARIARASMHWRLRAALLAGCVLSAAVAVWASDPAAYLNDDPALAKLLRGMAVLKGCAVLVAATTLLWRFGKRATAPVAISYCLSVWAMTATTMLIWQLTRIPIDAIVFHLALICLMVTAWRDDNNELFARFSRRLNNQSRCARERI